MKVFAFFCLHLFPLVPYFIMRAEFSTTQLAIKNSRRLQELRFRISECGLRIGVVVTTNCAGRTSRLITNSKFRSTQSGTAALRNCKWANWIGRRSPGLTVLYFL